MLKIHAFIVALVLCASAAGTAAHSGTAVFANDLVEVELHLTEPGLSIGTRTGHRADLRRLEACDGGAIRWRDQRRFVLPAEETCVRYRVQLRPVQGRLASVVPDDQTVVSPARFMWLPRLGRDDHVELTVESVQALSLPWQLIGEDRWRVRGSPHSNDSLAVIGGVGFPVQGLQQPATLVVSSTKPGQVRKAQRWLESNLRVLRVNPYAQVVLFLIPSQFGRSPVPYGDVIRDQGETVRFFVDLERSFSDLSYDWTAAHELAHLQLPYIDERWISEGFASYYQNVLQARRGAYSEVEAWTRLFEKFEQAEASADGMSPSDTQSYPFGQARLMIYWSGAALALAADVALREQGSSLDNVLGQLRACCLPERRSYSARELFRRLDALHGGPVLTPIYERYARKPGMPEYGAVARRLGVEYRSGVLTLDEQAPLATIRQQIMAVGP